MRRTLNEGPYVPGGSGGVGPGVGIVPQLSANNFVAGWEPTLRFWLDVSCISDLGEELAVSATLQFDRQDSANKSFVAAVMLCLSGPEWWWTILPTGCETLCACSASVRWPPEHSTPQHAAGEKILVKRMVKTRIAAAAR